MSVSTYETNARRAGHFLGLVLAKLAGDSDPDNGVAILVGSGVPAGATYGGQTLATGQNAIAYNADAGAVGSMMYFTVDGGVGWTVFSPTSTTDFGAAGLLTDVIDESTGGAGVTIESLKIEDQDIDTSATTATWTHTSTGAGEDLELTLAGANDASLILTSAGTGADAIKVNATAGGIDLDSNGLLDVDVVGAIEMDASGAISVESSAGAISMAADAVNQPLNLGTGGARAITVGSAAAASLTLEAGVGGLDVDADTTIEVDAGDSISIESSGGTINIGADAVAQALNLGTGAAARPITIGNAASASLALEAGVGAMTAQADLTMDLDAGGALSLNSSGAAINVGNDAVAQPVNLATGAAARVITIGNAASASMALDAGVGGFAAQADTTIELDAGTDLTIESAGGAISVGADAVAQPVNIATGGAARVITIGNALSASLDMDAGAGGATLQAGTTVDIDAGTTLSLNVAAGQTLNIADDAVAQAVVIGNAAAASLDMDAGVGGFTLLADTTADLDCAGAMSLNSSAGVINVGDDNVAQNINIGTAGARTISIGSPAAIAVGVGCPLVTTHGVTDNRVVGGSMYRDTEGTSLTSAGGAPDAETVFNIGTYTIPANTIAADSKFKLRCLVLISDGAAGASLTLRARLGGVAGTVLVAGASNNVSTNEYAEFDLDIMGTAAPGAAAAVNCVGKLRDTAPAGADTWLSLYTNAAAATNGNLDIVITGQWTGAAGDDANIEMISFGAVG